MFLLLTRATLLLATPKSGTATVTNGEQTFNLSRGESTYVPLDVTHSLENATSEPLEIIEVQSGT